MSKETPTSRLYHFIGHNFKCIVVSDDRNEAYIVASQAYQRTVNDDQDLQLVLSEPISSGTYIINLQTKEAYDR